MLHTTNTKNFFSSKNTTAEELNARGIVRIERYITKLIIIVIITSIHVLACYLLVPLIFPLAN